MQRPELPAAHVVYHCSTRAGALGLDGRQREQLINKRLNGGRGLKSHQEFRVSFVQIYADVKELGEPRPFPIPPRKMFVEAPRGELVRRYKCVYLRLEMGILMVTDSLLLLYDSSKLVANEDYAAFVNRTPIIGIWDDHDYGINDGGKFYTNREESQQVFLDFIGEPKVSPRREQQVL